MIAIRRALQLISVVGYVASVSCHTMHATPDSRAGNTEAPATIVQVHLSDRWSLPGVGGRDFVTVDTAARRLYVVRTTGVQVLDIDSGRLVGEIADLHDPHMVVVPPGSPVGFVTSAADTSVVVFDRVTLRPLQRLTTGGPAPDLMVYDPVSGRLVAFDTSGGATTIDVRSRRVAAWGSIGGVGESAIPDGRGRILVNLKDKGELVTINARTLRVERVWPLPGCEFPHALAADDAQDRLYVGCWNHLAIVDAKTGRIADSVVTGGIADEGAIDPELRLLYIPCGGEDTDAICVFRTTRMQSPSLLTKITMPRGSQFIAVDQRTHRAFLPVLIKRADPRTPQSVGVLVLTAR